MDTIKYLSGDISRLAGESVCLYSHFDYENMVDEYVFQALQEVASSGYKIIFISTCENLSLGDLSRLKMFCYSVVIRENIGLDFGGWAEVLNLYPQLYQAENILLTNDSVYGPIYALKNLIIEMHKHRFDFWGITESRQIKPHLQSYFINYGKNVVSSEIFRNFWGSYTHIENKMELIQAYEISLTPLLSKQGYKYGSIFSLGIDCREISGFKKINPTHHLWQELFTVYKSPFIKVELLRSNPYDLDLGNSEGLLELCGCDYSLVRNHLNRVSRYYKDSKNPDEINEPLKKVALNIRNEIMRKHGLVSSKYYKFKYVVNFIATKPVRFMHLVNRALHTAKRTFKEDIGKSYDNDTASWSHVRYTLADYRRARKLTYISARSEADCFKMRQFSVKNRLAVVCHIYYKEIYPEVLSAINHAQPADVFISLVEGDSDELLASVQKDLPGCYVQVFENYGRDIYPFLKFIESGILYNYDAVLKIHTKQSKNEGSRYDFDGESWRKNVLQSLAPNNALRHMLPGFLSSKQTGMLCPDEYVYGSEHMGSNGATLQMLCGELGLGYQPLSLKFPAGTMFWIKPWLLRHIEALKLNIHDFDEEPAAVDGTMAHAIERFFGIVTTSAGYDIASPEQFQQKELGSQVQPTNTDVIAYYLPQFHPVPENDIWWGKGFTEWRNVATATPLFETHYQPRVPSELGYYDLRMNDVQVKQAALAEEYGLTAFAFYHYWFSGKKMLSKPIDEYIQNEKINFRFLICWANENWTRSWDGLNKNVLLEQRYDDGWEEAYARDITPYLCSEKYYRRNGKPVLQIYNVSAIPNCRKRLQRMREILHEHGVGDVEILAVLFYGVVKDADRYGVDGFSEFPPHRLRYIGVKGYDIRGIDEEFSGNIFSYESIVNNKIADIKSGQDQDVELGVMCAWDNTARRRSSADIFHGSTPAVFRKWFEVAYTVCEKKANKDKRAILFVNAWNEWAEGTYLEPDMKYGRGYLEAIRSVIPKN